MLERLDFRVLLLHDFVQALDSRQGHAVGINRGDGSVIHAEIERGTEVLRYRPKVGAAVAVLVGPT